MNSIVVLANLIDEHMNDFIFNNPLNKNQDECEMYILGKIMRETKGHMNPCLLMSIIKIHRLPMEKAGFALQC